MEEVKMVELQGGPLDGATVDWGPALRMDLPFDDGFYQLEGPWEHGTTARWRELIPR